MQEQITILTDDIDGRSATHRATNVTVESIPFMLDGVLYEIDLGKSNAARLRAMLVPWIEAARPAGVQKSKSLPIARGRPVTAKVDTGAVRAWAREAGITVKAKGRIPAEIVDQWHSATNASNVVKTARSGRQGRTSHISLAS